MPLGRIPRRDWRVVFCLKLMYANPMNKKLAVFIPFILSALFGAYSMHKGMNETYVAPTFEATSKVIVTVDPTLIEYAQAWSIPEILFVSEESNPQVKIVSGRAEGAMVGAEATRRMNDDNHIVSCEIKVNPGVTSAMMTHEMGHCLGLSHETHKSGTNMYMGHKFYQQGWSDTVTDWDRENLRSIYTK